MPTITIDEFYQRLITERGATIIVPNKYNKNFVDSPAYAATKEIGKTVSAKVYQIQ